MCALLYYLSARKQLCNAVFTKGEQTLKGKPYGNSKKSSRPYKRTMKSTMVKIKTDVEKVAPRKVIHSLVKDRGGNRQRQKILRATKGPQVVQL